MPIEHFVRNLNDLTDVDLSGLVNGDSLIYNSSTGKFVPGSGGGGGGSVGLAVVELSSETGVTVDPDVEQFFTASAEAVSADWLSDDGAGTLTLTETGLYTIEGHFDFAGPGGTLFKFVKAIGVSGGPYEQRVETSTNSMQIASLTTKDFLFVTEGTGTVRPSVQYEAGSGSIAISAVLFIEKLS